MGDHGVHRARLEKTGTVIITLGRPRDQESLGRTWARCSEMSPRYSFRHRSGDILGFPSADTFVSNRLALRDKGGSIMGAKCNTRIEGSPAHRA